MDSAQYAELFLTESREHVSAINHSLLELERGAWVVTQPVSAIFRGVHTIKGMSATMGYTAVAALSHELETLLDRVRRGERSVDARLMDLLFRSADLLERAIEAAVSGVDAVDVSPMVGQLQAEAGDDDTHHRLEGRARRSPCPRPTTGRPGRADGRRHAGSRAASSRARRSRGCAHSSSCRRPRSSGVVGEVSPSIAALQIDEFDHDFALRLVTELSEDDVVARAAPRRRRGRGARGRGSHRRSHRGTGQARRTARRRARPRTATARAMARCGSSAACASTCGASTT